MHLNSNYQVRLIGYCSLEKELLLERFVQRGPSSLANLKGEYVIVIEGNGECYIITSAYGVCQYYYVIDRSELFHDDTVIGVLKKSQLPWVWNWTALADLAQLDHVLDNDTLHPQIHRVPPASILHFKQGILKISSQTWEQLHPPSHSDPYLALAAFNDETKRWITDKVAVSLSGGFDSRLLLSSLLKQGCRPLLCAMGFDNSTDVIIARQIALSLDLPLSIVTLNPEDYLRYGKIITALTNGTKTAWNWHTYLYTRPEETKLERDCVFFIGSNGEFARSYYLNKGIIALAANMASPLSLMWFWRKLKLRLIFKKEELGFLCPELSNEFREDNHYARLSRIIALCHHKLLSGLDRFYLEQRVRNFVGNGVKLYSQNVLWRTPLLSQEWVKAIWNLKRNWKLGSNWHRFAIAKNYPQLLNFPEEGRAEKIYCRAPLSYWFLTSKKYPIVSYASYPEWFQSDSFVEFIRENAPLLSELIEKNAVISIIEEHKREKNRTATIAFLLAMIFWLMNLKEAYR